MNALANAAVGDYLNKHFVSSFQKVGTFTLANGQKQGGNVASYFCLPNGSVLHAIAGPVDAPTMLREARWAVEAWKMAQLESKNAADSTFFCKMHADRLGQEHGLHLPAEPSSAFAALAFERGSIGQNLSPQGKVHLLLAAYPLAKVEQLYQVVFEKVLGEQVSAQPVVEVTQAMPGMIVNVQAQVRKPVVGKRTRMRKY